jgi:hypothetical protein
MHPTTKLNSIAQRQGGVVRRSQAIAAGISDRQIGTRINSERWIRVGSGTYRIFEMPGDRSLVRAAVAALPNAVASHNSAAAIHGLSYVDTRVTSVLVHSRTTHTFPLVKVYRCFDLSTNHVVEIDELPVTSPARTVVDLAAQVHLRQLGAIVDDAVAAGKTTTEDLIIVLNDVARKGKPGVTSMRHVLDRRYGEPRRASFLERRGNRLLRSAGLGDFVTEYPHPWSPTRRFDVAYRNDSVAIEWDSLRWHLQTSAFERDRFRDTEAVIHGWRVLRFTWVDVHERPDHVIASVRSALGR